MRLDFLGPAEGPAPSWGGLRALRPRAPCPGPTCLLGVAAGHWVEQEGRGHSGGQVQGRLLASELPRSAGFQVTCRPPPQPRCPPLPRLRGCGSVPWPGAPKGRAGCGSLRPALNLGSGPPRGLAPPSVLGLLLSPQVHRAGARLGTAQGHRKEVRGFVCRQTWVTPQLCTAALTSPLGS